jgi:hypothetical protein
MRSLIFCALLVLSVASMASAATYAIRGTLSSSNVVNPSYGMACTENCDGKFNLDGAGEVSVTYDSGSDTLHFYSSHNFWAGFGPFTNLVLTHGEATTTLSTSANQAESGSVSYDWGTDKEAAAAAETAFIDGLVAGDYWVQFAAAQYPEGIARANLDNSELFGTKGLHWTSALVSESESDSTGRLEINFHRATSQLTLHFSYSFKEKNADGTASANPTSIAEITLSNPFDDNLAYTINPDNQSTKSWSVTLETNNRFYQTLRSGLVKVTVTTIGGNAPTLVGDVVTHVSN